MNIDKARDILNSYENDPINKRRKDVKYISFGSAIVLFEQWAEKDLDNSLMFGAGHDIFYGPNFDDFVSDIDEETFYRLVYSGWFYDSETDCLSYFVS